MSDYKKQDQTPEQRMNDPLLKEFKKRWTKLIALKSLKRRLDASQKQAEREPGHPKSKGDEYNGIH